MACETQCDNELLSWKNIPEWNKEKKRWVKNPFLSHRTIILGAQTNHRFKKIVVILRNFFPKKTFHLHFIQKFQFRFDRFQSLIKNLNSRFYWYQIPIKIDNSWLTEINFQSKMTVQDWVQFVPLKFFLCISLTYSAIFSFSPSFSHSASKSDFLP